MTRRTLSLCLLTLLGAAPAAPAAAGVTASFRFPLANFEGRVAAQWPRLAVDAERNEIYALRPRGNDIRVFGDHGMEIFAFGDDFANASDLAIGRDGDIFLLTTGYRSFEIHLLDYRGEHVAKIELKNIPQQYAGFIADQMVYAGRSLYLVDSNRMLAIEVDEQGYYERAHDIRAALRPFMARADYGRRQLDNKDWQARELDEVDLRGFTVDRDGNLYFTVAVLFSAYKMSPDGAIERFGKAGSSPGRFGVPSGIAVDDQGYIYVADKLRSVVMIFDPSFEFQDEFGYRGLSESGLIAPDDLAIDNRGNVYVGQAANRGVSVFRVVHNTASPSSGIDAKPSVSEKPARRTRTIELPARQDFSVDHGTDLSEEIGDEN